MTLVIDGDPKLVNELITDVFGQFVDNPKVYSVSSSRWFNGPTTVTMSPVNDIERLQSHLLFGNITKREGRSIHLTLNPARAKAWIAISRTLTFAAAIPDYLRWEFFMLRFRIKAWFSGRSVETEFWDSLKAQW